MAKSKKRKNNTPRHKRMDRTTRLQAAPYWIPKYAGKNLVRGYSNHFGVDHLCAVTELELLGYQYSAAYKQKLKDSMIQRQKDAAKRKADMRRKLEEEMDMFEYSDDTFAFIAGYTDGGVPFGITWEEYDEQESGKDDVPFAPASDEWLDDEDNPF